MEDKSSHAEGMSLASPSLQYEPCRLDGRKATLAPPHPSPETHTRSQSSQPGTAPCPAQESPPSLPSRLPGPPPKYLLAPPVDLCGDNVAGAPEGAKERGICGGKAPICGGWGWEEAGATAGEFYLHPLLFRMFPNVFSALRNESGTRGAKMRQEAARRDWPASGLKSRALEGPLGNRGAG